MTLTLEEVAAAFNHWRSSQTQRGKIPQHLTEQAAALVKHYSKAEITRALRINHAMLKQWLKRQPEPTNFIALPMTPSTASHQHKPPALSDLSITARLASGTEILIQGTPEQAALLVSSLQQRGVL